jgi:probable F420-dependent oxidoreductase
VSKPTIGLFSANSHSCAEPEGAARIATLAEQLGYDSLWAGEHVVLPSPRVEPSPMDPDEPILDPLVALAHLAGRTESIRLGTGIVILPQRNPLVLAKQVASLDVLTGGRLILGIGVGYLEPEMRAIGVPMSGRAARAVEYLEAMRSLWEDEAPAYRGRHVEFEGVDAHPRPAQQPLPVVMGGHSAAAHVRAARHADGWYGFMIGLRAMTEQRDSLRRAVEETGRGDRPLHISVSPARPLDEEVVGAYAELGVDRLTVVPPPKLPLDGLVDFVESNAPDRVGAQRVQGR